MSIMYLSHYGNDHPKLEEAGHWISLMRDYADITGGYPSIKQFNFGWGQIACAVQSAIAYGPDGDDSEWIGDEEQAEGDVMLATEMDIIIGDEIDYLRPHARPWIAANLSDAPHRLVMADSLVNSIVFNDPTDQTLWTVYATKA